MALEFGYAPGLEAEHGHAVVDIKKFLGPVDTVCVDILLRKGRLAYPEMVPMCIRGSGETGKVG
jgi:hypothetical protein